MTPTLEWDSRFRVIKEKLYVSIVKLMNAIANSYEAAVYYHVYVLMSVYFATESLI